MYLKIQIFPKFSKYIFRDALEKKILGDTEFLYYLPLLSDSPPQSIPQAK